MKNNQLGRSGISVSELSLGTMMYVSQISEKDAFSQMDKALDVGINFFDTAEVYPVPVREEYIGRSEEVVGDWMANRGVRDKIVLATKVAGRSDNLTYLREGGTRVRSSDIIAACEASLAKLKTDYIDLYQIHWPERRMQLFGDISGGYKYNPDSGFPISEAVEAMVSLQKQGKIKCYGLSNETSWGVMKFIECAGDDDSARPVSTQNAYHLLNRTYEYDLAEVGMREDVGLLSYSPLAQGFLSGKYANGNVPEGSRKQLFSSLLRRFDVASDVISSYVELANELKVTPVQLAIAFVTSREFVTSAIFGAANSTQFDDIIEASKIIWNDEIEAKVAEIHSSCPNLCP